MNLNSSSWGSPGCQLEDHPTFLLGRLVSGECNPTKSHIVGLSMCIFPIYIHLYFMVN